MRIRDREAFGPRRRVTQGIQQRHLAASKGALVRGGDALVSNRTPSSQMMPHAALPGCILRGGWLFLLLEDLSTHRLRQVLYAVSWEDITVVLRWLASFHARFLGDAGEALWPSGTQHLDTRPESSPTSRRGCTTSRNCWTVRCGAYPTLVHGDAARQFPLQR